MAMAKKASGMRLDVPCHFRCPISLDIMKSPVSLCTGITYDRASIQQWLEAGNTTCPATMQPLPSTDLVPNHTLLRLIHMWYCSSPSSSSSLQSAAVSRQSQPKTPSTPNSETLARRLLLRARYLQTASAAADDKGLARLVDDLVAAARDPDCTREIVTGGGAEELVAAISGKLMPMISKRTADGAAVPADRRVLEVAVGVLASVLAACHARDVARVAKPLASPAAVSSLLLLLRTGTTALSRANAARVLDSVASTGDDACRLLVSDQEGTILTDLARLAATAGDDKDRDYAVDAALSCLVSLFPARRVKHQLTQLGLVPTLANLLSRPSIPRSTAENALAILEAASASAEGRAAICGTSAAAAVARTLTKVSPPAAERGLTVLWAVCCLAKDRRAQAAAAAENAAARILVVMQSGCCAPPVKKMAADLLRMLRANANARCLDGYDTKTIHIKPF